MNRLSDSKNQATYDGVLREMFSHYRDQTTRRWQYFTTILVLQGLAASNWKNIDTDLVLAIVGGGIALTTICLLMLISRIRYTIQHTARWINAVAKADLLHTGPQGTFSLNGVTIWVYLPLTFVLVFWLALLFLHPMAGVFSHSLGGALVLASFLVTFLVNWTVPDCRKPLILNGLDLASGTPLAIAMDDARTKDCTEADGQPRSDGSF